MKKLITYSYTILLILTCTIAFPFALDEITSKEDDNQEVIEVLDDMTENSNTNDTDSDTQATDPSTDDTESDINSTEPSSDDTVSNPQTTEPSTDLPEPTTNTDTNQVSYDFTTVSSDYFNDALFIGDSRTVGIYEYGNLQNATFFASSGLSVYDVDSEEVSVPNVGKVTLASLLEQKDFGKIYIMLGINELGYNLDTTINKYEDMVNFIWEQEPNAIIYLQANLYVTKSRSDSDNIYNNSNIDRFNDAVAGMADNQTRFFINVNEIFDDGSGNLNSDYTSDDTHVLGKYYADWCDWLATKAIVK